MKSDIDILLETRAAISDPDQWCRGYSSRDGSRYCIVGHINKFDDSSNYGMYHSAYGHPLTRKLDKIAKLKYDYEYIWQVNDSGCNEGDDVGRIRALDCLDQLIEDYKNGEYE